MSLWSTLVAPFSEYAFMRSALVACMALAVASGPLGTLLLLRRMGLVGDVLSHAFDGVFELGQSVAVDRENDLVDHLLTQDLPEIGNGKDKVIGAESNLGRHRFPRGLLG
jgi:hypothetical protein